MQAGKTPKTEDYFKGLSAPNIADMEIQLQQLVEQGVLTPEEANAELSGRSEMDNISTDPRLKQAQMDALLGLQDISDGGLTAMDEANLGRIRNEENTAARGQREAILQNAASRGLGGSGLELMSQMQNQQDSATRTSQRDMDVAGMAQQRALDALIKGGQLGGQMQAQDFSQQAQSAQANDAISKFNAQNKQQVGMANVLARNQAQESNLANRQNIANQNVALQNQQQEYNKNLIQKNYDNEIKKRNGQAGIGTQNAANAGTDNQNRANANNQLIGGLLGVGTSAALARGKKDGGLIEGDPTNHDSQARMLQPGEFVVRKDDVPEMLKKAHTDEDGEFDAAGFLDAITGHKYGYKKGNK